MRIAHVSSDLQGETDRLISDIAGELKDEGAALVGVVKVRRDDPDHPRDSEYQLRVLPDGPVLPITQPLGAGSVSCRLDPGALAGVVSAVERKSLEGTSLFILNKFGPEEAAGRGFCAVIGTALEHGIPVLVGVARASRDGFDAFADGAAEALPPDRAAIGAWCRSAMEQSRDR